MAHLERWHTNNGAQATFIVWENQTEQVFDGDGRPVVERGGQRQVNQTSPPLVTGESVSSVVERVGRQFDDRRGGRHETGNESLCRRSDDRRAGRGCGDAECRDGGVDARRPGDGQHSGD